MSTNSQETLEKVREIVETICMEEGISGFVTNEDYLSEFFYSLKFNLVVRLEENFDIFIGDEELVLENFDTVQLVASLVVESKLAFKNR